MTRNLDSIYQDASHSPGLALWHVTNRWQQTMRAALSPLGMTHVQFVLLAMLASLGRGAQITQRELADHAGTDVMMTSQVIRVLEEKGLVERHRHPNDGRAWILTPTPQGIKQVNLANRAVESADQTFFSPLGDRLSRFTQDLNSLQEL